MGIRVQSRKRGLPPPHLVLQSSQLLPLALLRRQLVCRMRGVCHVWETRWGVLATLRGGGVLAVLTGLGCGLLAVCGLTGCGLWLTVLAVLTGLRCGVVAVRCLTGCGLVSGGGFVTGCGLLTACVRERVTGRGELPTDGVVPRSGSSRCSICGPSCVKGCERALCEWVLQGAAQGLG